MAESTDPAAPRKDSHPGDGVARGTTRMEFFADAVFAIAFTLPIVEIELPKPEGDYAAQLAELWPSYLSYALSSLVIGLYWVNHHFSGAIYRTTGHRFLLATILFLVGIGFIDFPTRAFAEHLGDPEARAVGAIFYACSLAGLSALWLLKWWAGRLGDHVDRRLDRAYVRRLDRKYMWTAVALVAAAALSFARWEVGLALAGVVTLAYLRPPETPVFIEEAPAAGADEA